MDLLAGIRVLPDAAALAEAAAAFFAASAAEATKARGLFSVLLSGGSTPRAMHARLVSSKVASRIDWERVHFFWGDERCVPPEHPDSNYRMALETLLEPNDVPPENVHRIHAEVAPESAAASYEAELRSFAAAHPPAGGMPAPRFDMILLGMGDDGHTASLFPHSAAIHETQRWVVALAHTTPPPPLVSRVTVTPIVINAAAHIVFLVSGPAKAERVQQVIEGVRNPDELPSQIVRPTHGQLTWLLDADAASRLTSATSR
jgi:6-phosphogluconolactonase